MSIMESVMNNGYALCLKEWILDKRIKNELHLLLIISSLCAKTGYCFAGNKYFSDLFECSDVSISSKISKLEKLGYIKTEYKKRGAEIIERKIRLKNILIDDLNIFNSTDKKIFKDSNKKNNNKNILIPKDWYPKESTIAKLKEKGVIVDKAIDKFINSCIAKGYKYVDFDRAMLSWDWEKNGLVEQQPKYQPKLDDEIRAKL